ncbi:glycosyltransferase [Rhodococcus antarcticus]|uniref:Glycosyltransferase n=1 Tax=Rhodococcus antarcticus TaxID=2987751 RepID=A0ABY6P1D1_9NOCA|nr:glycosyltransferase [Rhodococcus antarcticus]UZJ24953.1 glycosyltransferase [Rhodococcus antarcticus]
MGAEPAGEPFVVVVAFHGAEALRLALDPLGGLDVLVVDNSSSADVARVARDTGAEYHDAGGNLGFARAVNLGVAHAAGRDVVLVNPDAVVDADTVVALATALHERGGRVAAAAPRLTGPAGEDQRVRWPFPTPVGAWMQALGAGRWIPAEPSFLVGAVLALNAKALAEIGGFEPSYFLYAEETDWQRRAVGAGWRLVQVDGLTATHVGGGTSSDEIRREVHFHAGGERYVRRWFGTRGWVSYRAATVVGSAVRAVVLPGERGRVARRRAVMHLRGPMRVERALRVAGHRSVVHVVLTDAFAGTEQLVCTEAAGLAARGWDVTVVGGDPVRMRAALGPDVRHVAAPTVLAGLRALGRVGRPDVVHAHLTAAELAAVLARVVTRAPVVATRHIAARRGATPLGGLVAPVVRRGLAGQIAISEFVAAAVGERCTVIPNGVASVPPGTSPRQHTVLVLQRLEPEKSTDVALRAWAASDLASAGWRLQVAGTGRELGALKRLTRTLDIDASVDFLGWVGEPGLLLDACGLLLAPAPGEPFGLSVAEAMAHGVSVVAADGGAHPEVLGPEALLFAPGDHEAASELLRTLAGDVGERSRRGAALRERQRQLFTVEMHLDGVERVYTRVTS